MSFVKLCVDLVQRILMYRWMQMIVSFEKNTDDNSLNLLAYNYPYLF